jgi:hypothetical protein
MDGCHVPVRAKRPVRCQPRAQRRSVRALTFRCWRIDRSRGAIHMLADKERCVICCGKYSSFLQSDVHQQLDIYEFIRDTGLSLKNRIGTDVSCNFVCSSVLTNIKALFLISVCTLCSSPSFLDGRWTLRMTVLLFVHLSVSVRRWRKKPIRRSFASLSRCIRATKWRTYLLSSCALGRPCSRRMELRVRMKPCTAGVWSIVPPFSAILCPTSLSTGVKGIIVHWYFVWTCGELGPLAVRKLVRPQSQRQQRLLLHLLRRRGGKLFAAARRLGWSARTATLRFHSFI